MIKIGSLFAGIGGFERGIEAAIPGSETIWQVEREPFCQKVLRKHWPNSKIYNDVRDITRENVEPVDMLIGGFPCQDISLAGKGEGLNGKKSGLWWEMHRIISELRPRVVVMENVAAITLRGGLDVVGSLASIGYDAEWRIISARDFGAPHRRDRWFCVAWPSSDADSYRTGIGGNRQDEDKSSKGDQSNYLYKKRKKNTKNTKEVILLGPSSDSDGLGSLEAYDRGTCAIDREGKEILRRRSSSEESPNADGSRFKKQSFHAEPMGKTNEFECRSREKRRIYERNYWKRFEAPSSLCRVDDGVPDRIHRLKALGNAIVPQCSEYVGKMILKSGILS